MSLQDETRRGDLARQVIENEVYADAYALIEQEITHSWQESRNPAEREELHRALRSLKKVQAVLQSTMDSGKVAAAQITLDRNRVQRIGDYFKAA